MWFQTGNGAPMTCHLPLLIQDNRCPPLHFMCLLMGNPPSTLQNPRSLQIKLQTEPTSICNVIVRLSQVTQQFSWFKCSELPSWAVMWYAGLSPSGARNWIKPPISSFVWLHMKCHFWSVTSLCLCQPQHMHIGCRYFHLITLTLTARRDAPVASEPHIFLSSLETQIFPSFVLWKFLLNLDWTCYLLLLYLKT